MYKQLFVLFTLFIFSGCRATQDAAYNAAVQQCQAEPKNTQAKCLMNNPNYNQFSAQQREVTTYTNMISEKVARKEITEAEAGYLIQSYANKVDANKRLVTAQEQAANAQQERASNEGIALGAALMCAGQRGGHC